MYKRIDNNMWKKAKKIEKSALQGREKCAEYSFGAWERAEKDLEGAPEYLTEETERK